MPNRIIRESSRTSPTLAQLSHGAERMFWRLTTVADDFGRFEAAPMVLLASCFPAMLDSVKVPDVKKWLEEMVSCQLVTTYANNGKQYGFFNTWSKHQIKRAKTSKHPAPTSSNISEQLPANVSEKREARSENTQSAAPTGFELLWSLHPGPKGPKSEALKAYRQAKPPSRAVEAMRAQVAYKGECDAKGTFCAQIPHLHRWLRKRRWEDEIPGPEPGPHDHLREMRACGACGGSHPWLKGQRLEPCPQETP